MIIVGEKINTSRKSIREAVEKKDADFIIKVARDQAEAGASYIDVNAGTFVNQEIECLWEDCKARLKINQFIVGRWK